MPRSPSRDTYAPYFWLSGGMIICQDDNKRRFAFDTFDFFSKCTQCIADYNLCSAKKIDAEKFKISVRHLRGDFGDGGWVTADNLLFSKWKSGRLELSRHLIYRNSQAQKNLEGFLLAWAFNGSVWAQTSPFVGRTDEELSVTFKRVKERNFLQRTFGIEPKIFDTISFLQSDIVEINGNETHFNIIFATNKVLTCRDKGLWYLKEVE